MSRTEDVSGRRLLLVLEATIGGTRRHLRDLAVGMSRRGWAVHVAYANRRDPDFVRDIDVFAANGIDCTEIDMRRAIAPLSDLAAVFRLRSLIRRIRPDVIHLHSSKAGLVGRLAAIGTGVRVIYSPHCFAFNMSSPFRLLYRMAEKMLVGFTDGLVAVCQDEARSALALGYAEDKVHLAYNGIDPPNATDGSNATKHDESIVFIGRSSRQKGLDILIAAYALVKAKNADVRLLVMSDVHGPMRRKLEALGAEVMPFGTAQDALALMSPASVLVLPSRWEAFPYTVLEALSRGMTVVAADVGGVGECIESGKNGILVPPGVPFFFASAITAALADGDLRRRISASAPGSVARFGIETMLDEISAVY